jgi:hypothetical protein
LDKSAEIPWRCGGYKCPVHPFHQLYFIFLKRSPSSSTMTDALTKAFRSYLDRDIDLNQVKLAFWKTLPGQCEGDATKLICEIVETRLVQGTTSPENPLTPHSASASHSESSRSESPITKSASWERGAGYTVDSKGNRWEDFPWIYERALEIIGQLHPTGNAISAEFSEAILDLFKWRFRKGDRWRKDLVLILCQYSTFTLSEKQDLIVTIVERVQRCCDTDDMREALICLDYVFILDSEHHSDIFDNLKHLVALMTKWMKHTADGKELTAKILVELEKLVSLVRAAKSLTLFSARKNSHSWRDQWQRKQQRKTRRSLRNKSGGEERNTRSKNRKNGV